MKKTVTLLLTLLSLSAGATEPVDYVSTLVGSQSDYALSTGNTYPALALPWGMNFWTAQTGKTGNGWAYRYDERKIRGFKQTHQPSPWINDYGQFAVMPVTGAPRFDEESRASWFSHKGEVAKPYYYKAYLADHDVVTEIAPTERAAMFRFTFPDDNSYVVIDGVEYKAMSNLGSNPSVGGGPRHLETHIFDFSGDLYGRRLRVELRRKIRDERKFDSLEELQRQIERDRSCILSSENRRR